MTIGNSSNPRDLTDPSALDDPIDEYNLWKQEPVVYDEEVGDDPDEIPATVLADFRRQLKHTLGYLSWPLTATRTRGIRPRPMQVPRGRSRG